jgi:hypothetical protein
LLLLVRPLVRYSFGVDTAIAPGVFELVGIVSAVVLQSPWPPSASVAQVVFVATAGRIEAGTGISSVLLVFTSDPGYAYGAADVSP